MPPLRAFDLSGAFAECHPEGDLINKAPSTVLSDHASQFQFGTKGRNLC